MPFALADLLAPLRCTLCNMPSHRQRTLCLPCLRRLPRAGVSCATCALPLPQFDYASGFSSAARCSDCLETSPPWDYALTCSLYEPPVDGWVIAYKSGDLLCGNSMAELLADMAFAAIESGSIPVPDLLTPVPAHPASASKRGFHHTGIIARKAAAKLGIAQAHLLVKNRQTVAQHKLSWAHRNNNLDQAFALKPSAKSKVAGSHIAVFDDVMTTGATLREAARVLIPNRPKSLSVWTIARTPVG